MPDHPLGGPVLYSLQEAQALLGIGRSTLYRLMERGEIETVHIGTRRLIARVAIEGFLRQKEQESRQYVADLRRRRQASARLSPLESGVTDPWTGR